MTGERLRATSGNYLRGIVRLRGGDAIDCHDGHVVTGLDGHASLLIRVVRAEAAHVFDHRGEQYPDARATMKKPVKDVISISLLVGHAGACRMRRPGRKVHGRETVLEPSPSQDLSWPPTLIQVASEEDGLVDLAFAQLREGLGRAARLVLADVDVAFVLLLRTLPCEMSGREETRLTRMDRSQPHPEKPALELLLSDVDRAMLDMLQEVFAPEDVALCRPARIIALTLLYASVSLEGSKYTGGDGRQNLLSKKYIRVERGKLTPQRRLSSLEVGEVVPQVIRHDAIRVGWYV